MRRLDLLQRSESFQAIHESGLHIQTDFSMPNNDFDATTPPAPTRFLPNSGFKQTVDYPQLETSSFVTSEAGDASFASGAAGSPSSPSLCTPATSWAGRGVRRRDIRPPPSARVGSVLFGAGTSPSLVNKRMRPTVPTHGGRKALPKRPPVQGTNFNPFAAHSADTSRSSISSYSEQASHISNASCVQTPMRNRPPPLNPAAESPIPAGSEMEDCYDEDAQQQPSPSGVTSMSQSLALVNVSFDEDNSMDLSTATASNDACVTPPPPTTPVNNVSYVAPFSGGAEDPAGYDDGNTQQSQKSIILPQNRPDDSSRFEYEFEVLGELGSGSFGKVLKCSKRLDGMLYAVKIIDRAFNGGGAARERVLKEVYALANLANDASENPHVVRYFSAWLQRDRLYIQTELCDTSLESVYREEAWPAYLMNSAGNAAKCERFTVDLLRQLLSGLAFLHDANVVHLDVKPANIFIKHGVYKLGDLGHAVRASSSYLSNYEMGLPLPPNAKSAPAAAAGAHLEQRQTDAAFRVAEDVDEGDSRYLPSELLSERYDALTKCDVFSLGASALEMYWGDQLPANGDEWLAIRTDLSSGNRLLHQRMTANVRDLLRLMMHPDPVARPDARSLLSSGGPRGMLLSDELKQRAAMEQELRNLKLQVALQNKLDFAASSAAEKAEGASVVPTRNPLVPLRRVNSSAF